MATARPEHQPEAVLTHSLERAEERVTLELPPEVNETAGCTANVMLIRESPGSTTLTLANVGDSRLVKGSVAAGDSQQWVPTWASVDHKPSDEQEKARIEAAGGRVNKVVGREVTVYRVSIPEPDNPNEWRPGLAVARSIGDLAYKRHGVSPKPTVTTVPLDARDRCLVSGSDGLYEFLSNDEIVVLCQQHVAAGAATAARALVLESAARWRQNSRKYRDDITALVLLLPLDDTEAHAAPPAEADGAVAYAIHRREYKWLGFPRAWQEAASEAPDDDERQGVERFNERLSSSGLDERLTLSRMTAPEKHSEHDDRFNERLSSSGLDERLTLSRMTALETHPVETAEVAAEDLSIEDAGFSFKPKAKANEEQANDDHPMVGIFAAVGDMSRRVTASLRQIGAPPAAA